VLLAGTLGLTAMSPRPILKPRDAQLFHAPPDLLLYARAGLWVGDKFLAHPAQRGWVLFFPPWNLQAAEVVRNPGQTPEQFEFTRRSE
jgi:hypothetical protein